MTTENNHLKINNPHIVHENIDGETIILNLDSGNYYSIVDVGADIWSYIEKGVPIAEILPLVRGNYHCNGADEENAVNSFLSQLQQEGLVIPANDASFLSQSWKDNMVKRESKSVFVVPVLNKYSDLKDLLLVDPIHEVDEAGWPSIKPSE